MMPFPKSIKILMAFFKKLLILTTCGMLLTVGSFADLKSLTGNLIFDIQGDGIPEASLNSTGFFIGTSSGSSNLNVQGNAIVTGSLSVGSSVSSASSNLFVSGSLGLTPQVVSSSGNLLESGSSTMVLADTSTQNITLNLPYAGNVQGRTYMIKKVSASNNLVITSSGNSIDGDTSILFPANSSLFYISVISNGREWYKLNSSSGSNTIASDNLVGWWKLDENSIGTVTDSSGRGNHGTHQNFSSANVGLSGHVGSCAKFLKTINPGLVNLGTTIDTTGWSEMTITAWINPNSNPWEGSILSSSNGVFNFACHNSDGDSLHSLRMYIKCSGGDIQYNGDSAQVSSNIWSHVAVSLKRSDNFYLYVDGSLKASTAFLAFFGTILTPNTTFMGNTNQAVGNSYGGYLDDVRIFNKKLSQEEIVQIMGGKSF